MDYSFHVKDQKGNPTLRIQVSSYKTLSEKSIYIYIYGLRWGKEKNTIGPVHPISISIQYLFSCFQYLVFTFYTQNPNGCIYRNRLYALYSTQYTPIVSCKTKAFTFWI